MTFELGVVRVWKVDAVQLIKAANTFRKLVGSTDQHTLSIIYEDLEVCYYYDFHKGYILGLFKQIVFTFVIREM